MDYTKYTCYTIIVFTNKNDYGDDLSIQLNNEDQEGSGLTSPLNDFILSDVSYGVDVCNRFACLLVEPTPDDCADPTIRSDCPDSSCMNSSCLTPQLSPAISLSSNSSSVPSSHGTHPAVLVVSKAENIGSLFQEIYLPPVQTKPSLPSDDASSGVCETVAPLDNLKDLFFTCLPVICPVWLNSFLNQWGYLFALGGCIFGRVSLH